MVPCVVAQGCHLLVKGKAGVEDVRASRGQLIFLLDVFSFGKSIPAAALDDDDEHDKNTNKNHDDDCHQP